MKKTAKIILLIGSILIANCSLFGLLTYGIAISETSSLLLSISSAMADVVFLVGLGIAKNDSRRLILPFIVYFIAFVFSLAVTVSRYWVIKTVSVENLANALDAFSYIMGGLTVVFRYITGRIIFVYSRRGRKALNMILYVVLSFVSINITYFMPMFDTSVTVLMSGNVASNVISLAASTIPIFVLANSLRYK